MKTTLRSPLLPRRGRDLSRGFTLIELLIAVIIIAILVAIIIPVLANRANDARLAATRSDLEAIQKAEEHAAIDTGYYYRLYVLDDVRKGDAIAPHLTTDITDGLPDEELRGDVPAPTQIFIDTQEGTLLDVNVANSKFQTLKTSETNFNWNGPYVNFPKKVLATDPAVTPARTIGLPLDPYGNPYLLFTDEGLLLEPDGRFVDTATFGANTYSTKRFDRTTILSLGPNGLPGDGTGPGTPEGELGQGDDLFRQF